MNLIFSLPPHPDQFWDSTNSLSSIIGSLPGDKEAGAFTSV
jgi:hypothetical protein